MDTNTQIPQDDALAQMEAIWEQAQRDHEAELARAEWERS